MADDKIHICVQCWEYQPIDRMCLKKGKKVEPLDLACADFTSVTEE